MLETEICSVPLVCWDLISEEFDFAVPAAHKNQLAACVSTPAASSQQPVQPSDRCTTLFPLELSTSSECRPQAMLCAYAILLVEIWWSPVSRPSRNHTSVHARVLNPTGNIGVTCTSCPFTCTAIWIMDGYVAAAATCAQWKPFMWCVERQIAHI